MGKMRTTENAKSKRRGVGYFTDVAGKEIYLKAYDEVMEAMSPPTSIHDINTSRGTVRAYEWLNRENSSVPPVVLLPGHSSGAPMWQKNMTGFTKNHTVYAVDALGDAGKSVQSAPLENIEDVTDWISETLDGLSIKRAHVVGHSFGGGYAANFALRHPGQVQTLTLLEPAFALNIPPFSTLFWASVASMGFLPEAWRNYGLAKISGADTSDIASDDPIARMVKAAATYYSLSLPTPKTLTTAELEKLDMPVYIALADHSPITGKKAVENANKIPNATVRVWTNTTHSLPMEVVDELATDLNVFWADKQ